MSVQITTAFVQQYQANVIRLSQQKGSKLRNTVRVDADVVGKSKFFDRIGATVAQKKQTRHGDTPLVDTPHSRRRVSLAPYEWADLVDDADKIRTLIDPASEYAINAALAFGRSMDDEIIAALCGTSYAGEDGSTTVALPSAQKVAQDGTPSSLTVAKLILAKTVLDVADVDPDEPRFIVVPPKALNGLLNVQQVTSADYNTVKALVRGEIDTFLGFKFIPSNRLPLVTTGTYRAAYCWVQSGVGLAIAKDIATRISERADKSYSVQVFVSMDIGATRVEDEKVVEIPCLATD